ncbi:MAG TPA: hypothetical protein VKD28_05755 [Gemmatimonadales bacterium]|nr:hypothetical protein [Gemmatimonadales bacterium]
MTRGVAAFLIISGWCSPAFAAFAQSTDTGRPISYGAEIAFRSGHADRGVLISDRPVIQPVTWVAGSGAEFSLWSSFPLAANTDRSRPEILEMELTHGLQWNALTIGPAVRTYFYKDPASSYSTRSIEGWLYLSLAAGPFLLFTNHSLDVLTYKGAYFGEAGIAAERAVSQRVAIGGLVGAGWASATFNEAFAGVATSALNRISAEGWLTAHVKPPFYIGSHIEFSTIVDPAVRSAPDLRRPTYVLVKLTTGGEF